MTSHTGGSNSRRRVNYKYAILTAVATVSAVGVLLVLPLFLEPEGEPAVDINGPQLEDVIQAEMTVQPMETVAGSSITVMGNGFSSGDQITISFNGEVTETMPEVVAVDDFARFTAEIIVPDVESGEYDVTAADESGNSTSVEITLVDEEEREDLI